jgi:hypothetical protein
LELSPKSALIGVVAIIAVAVAGVVEAPEKAQEIFGFCTMAVLTLLGIVNQGRISKKLDQNTQITKEAKQEAQTTKQEVKDKLQEVDLDKSHKLEELTNKVDVASEKLDIVVKQTNGPLTKQLNEIQHKVEEVKSAQQKPPAPQ